MMLTITRRHMERFASIQSSLDSKKFRRMISRTAGGVFTVHASTVSSLAEQILVANGAPPKTAAIVARCLIAADLRGVESHGISRLQPLMDRVRAGVLDAKAQPQVKETTPAVAQVDGCNGFGFVAANIGVKKACAMASVMGIGMVSVKRSNHFGMSASFAKMAIDAGMMSLVFTNSSPALPAFGGKTPLLGVSPICCGAPGGRLMRQSFIVDMAPSVAARGKVYKALRRGEAIPPGWALDRCGEPTTDPKKALQGVMLPIGGAKGAALASMMQVFSGVFSGGSSANVTNPHDPTKPANVSHFFLALKPDLFIDLEEFRSRMDSFYQNIIQSPKAAGVDRIYFPGEPEQLVEQHRLEHGIPYHIHELEILNDEASRCSLSGIDIRQRGDEITSR